MLVGLSTKCRSGAAAALALSRPLFLRETTGPRWTCVESTSVEETTGPRWTGGFGAEEVFGAGGLGDLAPGTADGHWHGGGGWGDSLPLAPGTADGRGGGGGTKDGRGGGGGAAALHFGNRKNFESLDDAHDAVDNCEEDFFAR